MTRPDFDAYFPTRYDFTTAEARILERWKAKNAFLPRGTGKPHVIVIPPPNVTGRLHMGHALNNTIQDMLTRFHRMDGADALWIPGTDHAGIATQTVVKKMLDAEGVDYRALGREKFVEKVWEWKEKFGGEILRQLSRIGSSCDWSRTRFTMDEGLSKAVARAFKKLYDDGLIYRGKRIVNWCPVDQTALSDDEVETKEGGEPGSLWHIKYLLADGGGELVVATTRPETLFGDVAVAVHPDDERYRSLVGKHVLLPLTDKKIPVIADAYVDRSFGTGCLKITPAHDANDFEVGARHGFEPVEIMLPDARMNDRVPERFRGLTREKCRVIAVAELEAAGLLVKVEPRMTPVGRSYRSRAIIEYRLSEQWFVKMKPLCEAVLARRSELSFHPARWEKVYLHWLNNIRDWCISRQIWWGHRIPAWYHVETGEILVDETTPARVLAEPGKWRQDEDVLDTWFSSGLWPMSTLGWPEKGADFDRYFPTTTLSTAKDILFFWVARMNMMAVHFEGKLPYRHVYIHPTVMDERGETMSKSKGNGIDPLHIIGGATVEDLKNPVLDARPSNMKEMLARIEKNYAEGFPGVGADAMRWTLIYLCSSGQELRVGLDNFIDLGRRFITKLWNAARFITVYADSYVGGAPPSGAAEEEEDRWMRSRIDEAGAEVRRCLAEFDFTALGKVYYELVWNDFCDWYVELCKVRLAGGDEAKKGAALVHLYAAFADLLKLLHPLIPFVTEELWEKLGEVAREKGLWTQRQGDDALLMRSAFPAPGASLDRALLQRFAALQAFTGAIRGLRTQTKAPDRERVDARYKAEAAHASVVDAMKDRILRMAMLSSLEPAEAKPQGWSSAVISAVEIYVDLRAFRDSAGEKKRLEKELEAARVELEGLEKRLGNPGFLAKARPEVVEKEKARKAELGIQIGKWKEALAELA